MALIFVAKTLSLSALALSSSRILSSWRRTSARRASSSVPPPGERAVARSGQSWPGPSPLSLSMAVARAAAGAFIHTPAPSLAAGEKERERPPRLGPRGAGVRVEEQAVRRERVGGEGAAAQHAVDVERAPALAVGRRAPRVV